METANDKCKDGVEKFRKFRKTFLVYSSQFLVSRIWLTTIKIYIAGFKNKSEIFQWEMEEL